STVATQRDLNANGSLRDEIVMTLSADGLSKATQVDVSGDGTFDVTTTDVTILNSDGSSTRTVIDRNADGSLRAHITPLRGADGISRTIAADATGNGEVDHAETVAVQANGSIVDTVTNTNADGSLRNRTVATTSASGLSTTTQWDTTG